MSHIPPLIAQERYPTGKIRFRIGFRRRVILEIEIETEIRRYPFGDPIRTELRWRDAAPEDLQYFEFQRAHVHLGWSIP